MALFQRLPARRAHGAYRADEAVRRFGAQTVGEVIDRLKRDTCMSPDRTLIALGDAIHRLGLLELDETHPKVAIALTGSWTPGPARDVPIRPLAVDLEHLAGRRARRARRHLTVVA